MQPRPGALNILLAFILSLFACNWPSRTVHQTYFINQKSSDAFDIPLAKKDSLAICATVTLSQWEVPSGDANLDSIKKKAKDSCQLVIEINANNKGVVQITDFDIELYYAARNAAGEQLNFTNFCKRNDWDLQCFPTAMELKDSLKKIGYDKMVSSQLLLRHVTVSAKLFEQEKLFARIKLKAIYNDWDVTINFVDSLHRKEIVKDYALHP